MSEYTIVAPGQPNVEASTLDGAVGVLTGVLAAAHDHYPDTLQRRLDAVAAWARNGPGAGSGSWRLPYNKFVTVVVHRFDYAALSGGDYAHADTLIAQGLITRGADDAYTSTAKGRAAAIRVETVRCVGECVAAEHDQRGFDAARMRGEASVRVPDVGRTTPNCRRPRTCEPYVPPGVCEEWPQGPGATW